MHEICETSLRETFRSSDTVSCCSSLHEVRKHLSEFTREEQGVLHFCRRSVRTAQSLMGRFPKIRDSENRC